MSAVGQWMLLTPVHRGADNWRAQVLGVVEGGFQVGTSEPERKTFTSAMTELNLMPASKGEIKGPSSIFIDQAKRIY